jgi:hypothetical protein
VLALLLHGRLAHDHSISVVSAIGNRSRSGGNSVMRFKGASA